MTFQDRYIIGLLNYHKTISPYYFSARVDFPDSEKYICKVTKTVEEAKELVESGFEYVTDMDCKKLFRKRK